MIVNKRRNSRVRRISMSPAQLSHLHQSIHSILRSSCFRVRTQSVQLFDSLITQFRHINRITNFIQIVNKKLKNQSSRKSLQNFLSNNRILNNRLFYIFALSELLSDSQISSCNKSPKNGPFDTRLRDCESSSRQSRQLQSESFIVILDCRSEISLLVYLRIFV